MKNSPFIPFYFEGNERWGWFRSPEEIKDLLKYYNYDKLRKARRHKNSHISFGFYSEYYGEYFGDWIDNNGQEKYFDPDKVRMMKLERINNKD